ncbi:hypothetical protein SAMN05192573_10699 [Mucilaginibacter gossypii]|uniref:Uncharacterized protein n=1 Tax=Mucilaginibacter gossypii TaxID=551996 RepID=A0A1G7Z021_9SPHI|nr:hypothetical protein SAMN05192573_10699 [Mucilaginibacter gossypii]
MNKNYFTNIHPLPAYIISSIKNAIANKAMALQDVSQESSTGNPYFYFFTKLTGATSWLNSFPNSSQRFAGAFVVPPFDSM